jgi:hypothetical protein
MESTLVSVIMQNDLSEKLYKLSDIIIFWYIKAKKYKYSSSHDISLRTWKPKVQYSIHMSLPPAPTLNHIHQINILTLFITEVHFSIILPSRPAILKWFLSYLPLSPCQLPTTQFYPASLLSFC